MSNPAPFDQLTSTQRAALISTLAGDSLGRTAALASVTDRIVRRWRRQPAFQASIAAAFPSLVDATVYPGNRGEQLKG